MAGTMNGRILFIAALLVLGATTTRAKAAQPTSGCSLSGAAIAFGAYDPTSAIALDTAGAVVYRCTQRDRNIMITLSQGGGTSYATRRMVKGADQLFYNLYRDAGRTVIWGDGSAGTQAYIIQNPPNNQDINVPIFGRIPALQNAGEGVYGDTITVTLTF
jgi:spore coat protein U-like protein